MVFLIAVAGTVRSTKAEKAVHVVAAVPNLLGVMDDPVVTGARPLVLSAPDGGWDFSNWDSLLVKLHNKSDQAVTVWARAENADAAGMRDTVRNAVVIDPKADGELRLRLTRRPQDPSYAPFKPFFMYYNGLDVRRNTVNPAAVSKIVVWLEDTKQAERRLVVKSVSPFEKGVAGPVPFFPFIDKYGQYKHANWPGKVYRDEDFAANIKRDQAEMAAHSGSTTWNMYGGWRNGPALEKTGFFYTKKVDGKWWLIDPLGNLFWSYGVTGVHTSGKGGPVTGKESWFEELPDENGPYGKYWTQGTGARFMYYRDGVPWKGFSFGALNAERKYGPNGAEARAESLHGRLRNWGFNTIGAWSNSEICFKRKTPYVVVIHPTPLLLNHMPDVFSEDYAEILNRRMDQEKDRSAGDPWCIGYFIDNELLWGPRARASKIVDGIMAAPANAAAKKAFAADLMARYKDIGQLNTAWTTSFESWAAFMEPIKIEKPNDAYLSDAGDFAMKFAERYFSTVRDAVKRVAPNQLYMGCRFNGHIDKAVVQLAAKYCDVISYNIYELPSGRLKQYDGVVDKPFIVGEFGVATDPVQSPWLDSRKESFRRPEFMAKWLKEGLNIPSLVGAHFFQFSDQPVSGRADGEALLRGFVDVTDTPHFDLVRVNREVGYRLYEIRSSGKFPEELQQ
jgi:hypothetical protein